MEKIYASIKDPGSFSSIQKLYKSAKTIDKSITLSKVKNFLKTQASYTIHRATKSKFNRRRILTPYPGHMISLPVMVMSRYRTHNPPYYLVLIDGFSRFLSVIPLINLKSTTITPVLDTFFSNNIYIYRFVYCDQGKELYNKTIDQLYKKLNIKYYYIHSSVKATLAERVIRTIKNKIARYITHFNDESFSKVLPQIVESYNHSLHRSLNEKPINIHLLTKWQDARDFTLDLYKRRKPTNKRTVYSRLSVGDVVRIKASRKIFKKEYFENNTRELFKICGVNTSHVPITYNLADLEAKPIKGIFYKEELVPAYDSGEYNINVLRKRKRKGKTELLVQFADYPNSKPKWTDLNQTRSI